MQEDAEMSSTYATFLVVSLLMPNLSRAQKITVLGLRSKDFVELPLASEFPRWLEDAKPMLAPVGFDALVVIPVFWLCCSTGLFSWREAKK